MALMTFPLSAATFIDRLPIARMTFDIPEQMELSQDGGGQLYGAELAPRVWQGEVRLDRLLPEEEADAMALIDLMRGGRRALFYDRRRPWPQADRGGVKLGSATPVLSQLASNARQIAVSGLPAGYVLRRGDYIGWDYLGRRAVHKVMDVTVAASGAGATGLFEVIPAIRPGAAAGAAVRLTRVSCTGMIVPKSTSPGSTAARLTDGVAFRWQQTLEG